jgi:hypothetical protein
MAVHGQPRYHVNYLNSTLQANSDSRTNDVGEHLLSYTDTDVSEHPDVNQQTAIIILKPLSTYHITQYPHECNECVTPKFPHQLNKFQGKPFATKPVGSYLS